MSTELVVTAEPIAPAPASLFSAGPREMVGMATEIATVLADVVEKQKLYSDIQGKKYVKAEGWSTLGCMLGITPHEVSVTELEDGSYEAVIELRNSRTGVAVGRGSALCGKDEARWGRAERYARRSMAVTRATGKAYRLCFSWIMTLAGYQPTPAEEMPEETAKPAGKPKVAAETSKPQQVTVDIPFDPAAQDTARYLETDDQKRLLAAAAKKRGVTHTVTLQVMSKDLLGIALEHLDPAVAEWIEMHPEAKK